MKIINESIDSKVIIEEINLAIKILEEEIRKLKFQQELLDLINSVDKLKWMQKIITTISGEKISNMDKKLNDVSEMNIEIVQTLQQLGAMEMILNSINRIGKETITIQIPDNCGNMDFKERINFMKKCYV